MITREDRAARALLAYFNHSMVSRIVRRVMKDAEPDVRDRFARAMLDRIPKALDDAHLHGKIVEDAERRVIAYLGAAKWKTRVESIININADRWASGIVEQLIKDRARDEIARMMKSWEMQTFMKGVLGRLQAAIEEQIRLNSEAVAKETTK